MDYYQGYEDAMRQTRVTRSTGLIGFFIRTIVSILYSAFIYVPLLILGYFLASRMASLYSGDIYVKVGLTLILCYGLFSFIYFLKGVLIGLRNIDNKWWVVLWIVCVLATCGIQAFFAQGLIEDFLASRQVVNYQIWSWMGSSAIGILIYSHYQFLTNIAPSSVFWIYRIGFLRVGGIAKGVRSMEPKKSVTYFDNAPMKVSFKKQS
jgi:hypothetical protein